jgi:spore coat protein CotH
MKIGAQGRVPLTKRTVGALCTAMLALIAVCFAAGCTISTSPGGAVNASTGTGETPNYEAILADRYNDQFPDDKVVTVRVLMKDADFTEMQANVRAKEYYKADIWIGDELVQDVAVRTKGSSSLMAAASAGSFRAGLKIDFNFFNQARSYHGIKKLVYNNGFSDPTLMKEFLGYELMAEMGVPTPRACFADLWVNDALLGVYTQVEVVDGTFVADHFGDPNGNLYKPEIVAGRLNWTEKDALAQTESTNTASTTTTSDSFNVGGGDLEEIIERAGDDAGWIPGRLDTYGGGSTSTTIPQVGGFPGGGGGFPGGGGGMPGFMGGSQNYLENVGLKTNEDKSDYSRLYDLLDVLATDPAQVSAADLERVLDVDETLRFLAVSVALVHLDNYIGMGHNYYLYEDSGVFSVVPWDLNMSFGGFDSGLSEDKLLSFYIDEPTSAAVSNYPLVAQLMDEPEFVAAYHSYLQQLIDGPFSLEHMTARIDQIAAVIRPYVKNDDNLLFSYEAFEQGLSDDLTGSTGARGANMGGRFIGLTKFVQARTASIAAQLAGTQASKSTDGSGNGGVIGVGGMGGGFPGGGGNFPGAAGNRPGGQQGGQQPLPGGQQGGQQPLPGGQQGGQQPLPGGQQGGAAPGGNVPGGQAPTTTTTIASRGSAAAPGV